jgi:prolipoprotein diacylglyceryltransferase
MWVHLNGDGVLEYAKLVPTQLFEAVFLALLFFYIVLRVKDKQTYCLQIYMCVYGVWRFIIEYMRNDYRGTTVIESVTPSQLIAILMVLGGAALMYLQYRLSDGEKEEEPALVEGVAEANEEAESDESVENADSDEEAEDDYEYASTYAKKDGDGSGNAEDNK